MKKHILIGAMLSASLIFTGAANAQEGFIDGFQAAENHEYQQAALQWETLAQKGDATAQFMLGMMYHGGLVNGTPDEKTAVVLYEKAAQGGNLVAQEYLAVGYREGWFGLKKDTKKARFWEKELEKVGELR
ncbi:MAG: hypothetical protein OEZ43_12755 [Gammaproteobacteria bacterium]|nr:hypothetical protein [Gammaproteobacteria bacterium]